MTYGDERGGDDRGGSAGGSVGALPAGDCWPTEGAWPAGPSYWLPRPRASRERGADRRPDVRRVTGADRRPGAEPDLGGDLLLPGEHYWPAGEDYWTGPGLGGRGASLADQAAGSVVGRDEPADNYPVYDYEDGQP